MGFIGDLIEGIKKTIPVVVQKVVTVLLIFFFLGALFGFYILPVKGPIALAGLAFVMLVIYYKLDEGFLLLLLYFAWIFY